MWKKGEKQAVAEMAGVSPGYLSNVLARRHRASGNAAVGLADACAALRIPIKREDFVFNKETDNPYFAPKE